MEKNKEISLLRKAKYVDPKYIKILMKSATSHKNAYDMLCSDINILRMQLRCNENNAYVRWVFEDNDDVHILTTMDDFFCLSVKALCRKLRLNFVWQKCTANGLERVEELSLHRMLLRASAVEIVFKKEQFMYVIKSRYGIADSIIEAIPQYLIDNDYLTAMTRPCSH